MVPALRKQAVIKKARAMGWLEGVKKERWLSVVPAKSVSGL